MADPVGDVKTDLGDKFADLRAGRFQLNGATIWLMVLIGLGLFLAYTLLIKKKAATTTTGDTTQPTSGQQPAAFISAPVDVVVEPTPVQVAGAPPVTVTTPVTVNPPPPVTSSPVPGPTRKVYQVQSGDTLSSIAAKEHLNLNALESIPGNWTQIRNTEMQHGVTSFSWDFIYPGETLFLN